MNGIAREIGERVTALQELNEACGTRAKELLVLVSGAEASDRDAAEALLAAIDEIGRSAQAREGELVLLLAQAHRIKANKGRLTPWLSTHLDVTEGTARGIARSACEIGHIPELAEPLASGQFGVATIRALTRAARAVKGTDLDLTRTLTDTLDLVTEQGVGVANKKVRLLEQAIYPGRAQRILDQQRSRSFLRMVPGDSGMYRIEALLDPERATEFKATLDQTVAAWLRARQYGRVEQAGDDIHSVEQLQAHALIRFAQVFAAADAKQRRVQFSPGTIDHAPLGSSALRIALARRDRTCRYPGCDRPPLGWSLHAHHVIPYSQGGETVIENLAHLCTAHYTLAHHPGT